MASYRRREPARRRSRPAMVGPITVILIILVFIFGMSVFFRVQNIVVEGASIYTEEEIIEASGIDQGDNLLFVNCSRDSSRIFSRLPYVESAVIRRELPDKIIITVSESYATAYISVEYMNGTSGPVEELWAMNGACKMLGQVDAADVTGLIHVLNVTPISPSEGETMEVAEDESLKLTYLQSLLAAINTLDMTADVSEIDLSNAASPTFTYVGRFTVKMGPNENTEYKLRMLMAAVEQIDSDMTGTIDLTEGTTVHMSPD